MAYGDKGCKGEVERGDDPVLLLKFAWEPSVSGWSQDGIGTCTCRIRLLSLAGLLLFCSPIPPLDVTFLCLGVEDAHMVVSSD